MGAVAATLRGRAWSPSVPGRIAGVRTTEYVLLGIAAAVGLLGIGAYVTGTDLMAPFFPGITPFPINNGIALFAAALAVALDGRRAGRVFGAICLLIGGLTFFQVLAHTSVGIDRLFATPWDYGNAIHPAHPGRMAPNSALCMLLLGCALVLPRGRVATVLTSAVILIGLVALLGRTATDANVLASIGQNAKMALATAVGLTSASFGLLLRREHAFFARDTVGGTVTRRLGPLVLILPLVGGGLLISGIKDGTFTPAAGIWVLTVGAVLICVTVLLWISRAVDRQEMQAHAGLSLQATTAANLNEGLVLRRESDGAVISVNPALESMFGYAPGELVGTRTLFVTEESDKLLHAAVLDGTTFSEEMESVRADGSTFWASVKASSFDHPEHGQMRVALYHDITERREAEATQAQLQEERAAAMVELERSNEDLEQFAHVASHDLSEPLRVVAGFVGLLQRRYQGKLDADADEFIGATVSGVERMQALIDALLAYSRVGSNELKLELVDLNALIGQVEDSLAVRIAESGGEVVIDGDLPSVAADPVLLQRVFQNLISNALKFTSDRPPRIDISAEATDFGQWTFRVRDNGEGIDPQYAERVFGMFQRLHGREMPGTGIGLSISRRIVEKHGGRIWVNEAEGGGSVFTFTLGATVQ